MGVSLLGEVSSCGCSECSCKSKLKPKYKPSPTKNLNLNPANFRILEMYEVGDHLVARIKYPDCINYEGEKVLLYLNCGFAQLEGNFYLDPHFCKGDHLSPFARFEPTKEGWKAAILLASMLPAIENYIEGVL